MSPALYTLICVLLSLFLLNSPASYYEQDIYDTESANQAQVDAIYNDQSGLDDAVTNFSDEADYVVVIDLNEN